MPKKQTCHIIRLLSDSKKALPLTQNDWASSVSLLARPRDRSKAVDGARRCVPQLACLFCSRSPKAGTLRNSECWWGWYTMAHTHTHCWWIILYIVHYWSILYICQDMYSTVSVLFIVSQWPVSVPAFQSCFESRVGLLVHVSGERRSSGSSNSNCPGRLWHRTRWASNKAKSRMSHKVPWSSMKFHEVSWKTAWSQCFEGQLVLNVAQMDGDALWFISRCGGLASDGPKIGPDFATTPVAPSHADAPWFGHWFIYAFHMV